MVRVCLMCQHYFGGQPGIAPTQLPPPHLPLTLPSPQQPALNASTPVSPKVAEKILKGQFVDMTELLPDSWRWEDASLQLPSHCPPRRPPVTEITVWVECFTLMAGVVISRFCRESTTHVSISENNCACQPEL